MEVNIEHATVTVLLEIDGHVHLIGLHEDKLMMIELITKRAAEVVIPTGKTQNELLAFLNYRGKGQRRT